MARLVNAAFLLALLLLAGCARATNTGHAAPAEPVFDGGMGGDGGGDGGGGGGGGGSM